MFGALRTFSVLRPVTNMTGSISCTEWRRCSSKTSTPHELLGVWLTSGKGRSFLPPPSRKIRNPSVLWAQPLLCWRDDTGKVILKNSLFRRLMDLCCFFSFFLFSRRVNSAEKRDSIVMVRIICTKSSDLPLLSWRQDLWCWLVSKLGLGFLLHHGLCHKLWKVLFKIV